MVDEKRHKEVQDLIDAQGGVAKFRRAIKMKGGGDIPRSTVTNWYYGIKAPSVWALEALKKAYFPRYVPAPSMDDLLS